MLVLTVNPGELVFVGNDISIRNNGSRQCKLAFDAPRSVTIEREKVRNRRLSSECALCHGCGKVTDTVVPEAWSAFSAHMPKELVAVTPSKPCPECKR